MYNILNQLPGFIAWKDNQLRYLGCNQNLARALGLKNPASIIGLSDAELGNHTEATLNFYQDTDKLALSGQVVKIIHSIGAHDPRKIYLLEKKPLTHADGQIVGTLFHCVEFVNPTLQRMQERDQKYRSLPYYHVGITHNPYQLSTRELECLFCVLRGMSAKKIAERLQLSKRTVESYLENLKNKLGCETKAELLAFAMQQGYFNMIPSRFCTTV